MDRTTAYFRNEVLRKRPYLTIELCRRTIRNHCMRVEQDDGRIKFWVELDSQPGKFLRVVTLEDGVTIHNAFLDRGFKPNPSKR